MAIYHLTASTWSAGQGKGAGGHSRYIARTGPYSKQDQECILTEMGHMPDWVKDPADYWDAADRYERKNGTVYREIEVALPAELSERKNIELARQFAEFLATDNIEGGHATPYQMAIHKTDEGLLHAHIMISDKINDGLDRDPQLWFKRAATKDRDPASGGAMKTRARLGHEWLQEVVRPKWQELANEALERDGHDVRIDMRSLAAQKAENEIKAQAALESGDLMKAAQHMSEAEKLDREPQKKGHHNRKAPQKRQVEQEQSRPARSRPRRALAALQKRIPDPDEALVIALDTQTERESRPGVRPAEKPAWRVHRERLLTETYSQRFADKYGKYVDVKKDARTGVVRITNKHIDITDVGDRITVGKGGTDLEIKTMLAIAQEKGWKTLHLTGSEQFKEKAAAAALKAGFALDDKELEERARNAINIEKKAKLEQIQPVPRPAPQITANREKARAEAKQAPGHQNPQQQTQQWVNRLQGHPKGQPLGGTYLGKVDGAHLMREMVKGEYQIVKIPTGQYPSLDKASLQAGMHVKATPERITEVKAIDVAYFDKYIASELPAGLQAVTRAAFVDTTEQKRCLQLQQDLGLDKGR